MADDIQVFVELTHHTLHALRAVKGTVEAGGEAALENRPAMEALLDAVAPGWKTAGFRSDVTVWPDGAGWHVSTDTEAMLDRTPDALRVIAAASQEDPRAAMAYAACGSADGGAVTPDGMDKWVLASASQEALGRFSTLMEEIRLESEGIGAAAFETAAAICAALRQAGSGTVALWDLGATHSHLLLVTGGGVEAAVACDVGLEAIYAAVQAALRLKFRGAGERLFFNETYDFTEAGPKVGAAIGPKVKLALAQLPAGGGPPVLACIGLTGRQAWFLREVAAVAGTTHWAPEIGTLAAALGLSFSSPSIASAFSPASAGLLEQVSSRLRKTEAWRPAWTEVDALPEEEPAPTPEPAPAPEPVEESKPAPAPVRTRPSLSVEPGAQAAPPKATRPQVAPRPAGAPAPVATFAPGPSGRPSVPTVRSPAQESPSPAVPRAAFEPPGPAGTPRSTAPTSAAAPAFNPPEHGEAPRPAAPAARAPVPATPSPSFSRPGFVPQDPPEGTASGFPPPPAATAGAAAALPLPAVTALPFEAIKPKLAAAAAPAASAPEEPEAPPKSKTGFYIGLGVAAALVFAAIAVVLDARMERIKAFDLEQQEALAHHVAEQRLKEAEQSAKDEAERSRKELETAIEITRKQTEDETRRQVLAEVEAERLAKLPGSLLVATSPSGASVSIDGGAPLTSPVRLDAIAPGEHRIQITLTGREPVDLRAVVKGSKATDLGTVALRSSVGTLEVSSSPDGLDFAVRAASAPMGPPLRTGKAPATLGDLPHGDYIVTFSRPGCRDHPEKASVEKGMTSSVGTKYTDGSLELTSDPSGAWVDKDGERLGTTPLSLHDLTPKQALFELTLPGYDPTPVTCEIPEGQTLKLEAKLLRRDRVFAEAEVRTKPVRVEAPEPSLSAAQRRLGATVLLSLVVRSDGSVSDVVVEKATDDDIARRCKDAVLGWRFRPATAPDGRTVDSRIELPFAFPAGA